MSDDSVYCMRDFEASCRFEKNSPAKYYYARTSSRAGINHLRYSLQLQLKEALFLGRTLVVFDPLFSPWHNFGRKLDSTWEKYLDLNDIRIDAGKKTLPVHWVRIADFEQSGLSILRIDKTHKVSREQNATYDLVIRNDPMGLTANYNFQKNWEVHLSSSAAVREIAARIIATLGEYTAVHVRRGDKLDNKSLYPNLENDTQASKIRDTLRRFFPHGGRLYVLTNEPDPKFFDPLKDIFEVRQYFDFPILREIIGCVEPDNFFLYLVEQEIFWNCPIKVHTFAKKDWKVMSLTTDVGPG